MSQAPELIMLAGAVLALGRPAMFAIALLVRLRWKLPVWELERLLRASAVLPSRRGDPDRRKKRP